MRIIQLLLLLLPALSMEAQTSALGRRLSPGDVAWRTYANPAVMEARYDSSLTEIAATYRWRNTETAPIAQMGDGERTGQFRASSYTRLSPAIAVWGKAGYDRSRTDNVQWNENADFLSLYPYVMADTLGGNLDHEGYLLELGYAQRLRPLTFGFEFHYSSSLYWRDHDPRPKDKSLNLSLKGGVSVPVGRAYAVGVYGRVLHYTQEQNVAFMNPYGTTMLYHMTGLGTEAHRYGGTLADAYYHGTTFGGGLTLHATEGRGFEAMAEASHRTLEKQLSGLNNAPLNNIGEWNYQAEAAYRGRQWYVSLKGEGLNRRGKEHVYDNGVNNYHEIALQRPFSMDVQRVSLSGSKEFATAHASLSVTPVAGFTNLDMRYIDPWRKMSLSAFDFGARLHSLIDCRGGWLTVKAGVSYWTNSRSRLFTGDHPTFTYSLPALRENFRQLSANAIQASAGVRYDFLLSGVFKSLFVAADYHYTHANTHNRLQGLTASAGVTL